MHVNFTRATFRFLFIIVSLLYGLGSRADIAKLRAELTFIENYKSHQNLQRLVDSYGRLESNYFPYEDFEGLIDRAVSYHTNRSQPGSAPILFAANQLLNNSLPARRLLLCARADHNGLQVFLRVQNFCLVDQNKFDLLLDRLGVIDGYLLPLRELYYAGQALSEAHADHLFRSILTEYVKQKGLLPPQPYREIVYFDGYLRGLDPHSRIEGLSPFTSRHANFPEHVGIGIEIDPREVPYIHYVRPNSPAARAGLLAGDRFLEIGGKLIGQQTKFDEIVKLIQGPIGSSLHLRVLRKNSELSLDVSRQQIVSPVVSSRQFLSTRFIQFESFEDRSVGMLEKSLRNFEQGVILDLRGNGGGLQSAASGTLALFFSELPKEPLAFTLSTPYGYHTVKENWEIPKLTWHYDAPVVVLTDRRTGSASEVVASVLKHTNRAMIVGERTFGKGTIQTTMQFSITTDGSGLAISYTEGYYFTYGNFSPQFNGVEPQVEIPNRTEVKRIGESDLVGALEPTTYEQPFTYQTDGPMQAAIDCARSRRQTAAERYRSSIAELGIGDEQLEMANIALDCLRQNRSNAKQ